MRTGPRFRPGMDHSEEELEIEEEFNTRKQSSTASTSGRKPSVLKKDHFTVNGPPHKTTKRKPYQCNYCEEDIVNSENQHLALHILVHCKKVTDQVRAQVRESLPVTQASQQIPLPSSNASGRKRSGTNRQQATGGSQSILRFADAPLTAEQDRRFAVKLLRWVAMSGTSFLALDSPYFLDVVQELRPGCIPPCKPTAH